MQGGYTDTSVSFLRPGSLPVRRNSLVIKVEGWFSTIGRCQGVY